MRHKKLRICLVGLGTWARNGHLPVYQGARMRQILDVVSLCSRNRKKASKWCAEWGTGRGYENFSKMLDQESPDVAVVCTPDSLHTEYVLKALDAGCHVVVEKPLATSTRECSQIMQKAEAMGREVIVLYHKRSDPLWAEARQRVLRKDYGRLQMGWALIENPLTVPTGSYFASDMAGMTDANWFLGTHFYDLIRYITGLNPKELRANSYYGKLKSMGHEIPDAMKIDMHLENNAAISFFLAWNLPQKSPALTKQCMTLHFEEGELELDGMRRGFTTLGPDGYAYANPYFMRQSPAGVAGYGAHFLEEVMLHLYDPEYIPSVEFPTLEDAWWATATAEAAEKSSYICDKVILKTPTIKVASDGEI